MALTKKEIKARYFERAYENANWIDCACGCGTQLKDRDLYGRLKTYINGHNGRKYDSPTQYKREWNHRHRLERMLYKRGYHRKRKVKLVLVAGGKCLDCGIEYNGQNACIFHFHHRDREAKEFAIGNQVVNKSWQRLLAEMEKCDMLCANCHEMRHSEPF
ncbi:MAG: hypothetical protein ACR2LC_00315 [Pyrinomonadaceae bacterium]